jgi:hypothetical protein
MKMREKFLAEFCAESSLLPDKKQVTQWADANILAWLRQQGAEGDQSRVNTLLRDAMLRDFESKRKRLRGLGDQRPTQARERLEWCTRLKFKLQSLQLRQFREIKLSVRQLHCYR